jgi:hypothetical protein
MNNSDGGARFFRDTMFLSPCRFLLQSPWTPKQKSARRDEAKGKREPILASNWDDMNPSMTDGNPADNRIIQILSAFNCRFLWLNTGSLILT